MERADTNNLLDAKLAQPTQAILSTKPKEPKRQHKHYRQSSKQGYENPSLATPRNVQEPLK